MIPRQQAQTRLTPVNQDVLRALNRFRFLTAAQLNRLMWPENTRDRNRYAQRLLHKLALAQYALVIGELPTPDGPAASLVYTLDWRGRKALVAAGEPVPTYYRPSELAQAARNPWFMRTLRPSTVTAMRSLRLLRRRPSKPKNANSLRSVNATPFA